MAEREALPLLRPKMRGHLALTPSGPTGATRAFGPSAQKQQIPAVFDLPEFPRTGKMVPHRGQRWALRSLENFHTTLNYWAMTYRS